MIMTQPVPLFGGGDHHLQIREARVSLDPKRVRPTAKQHTIHCLSLA
jgi:hypothetical protein